MPFGHIDRRRELLAAWERRSRARGGIDHGSGADALFLITALSNALRHASETPELGRAARTWGARFGAPVDALASLALLRDALTGVAEDATDGLPVPLAVLNRIFDQAALEAVDAASANLRSEARNDPLTGCANRRALDEDLAHASASARRSNLDLAVAVVDLDGLKQINDTKGHAAGDAALIDLVAVLRRSLREADTLYRTGGDEFVVVAPFTDAAGARALMRRAERMDGPLFSWGVASLAGVTSCTTAPVGGVTASGVPAVTASGVPAVTTSVIPDTTSVGERDVALPVEADAALLMGAADSDLYERRRANRRASALAARRRSIALAAAAAASIAVTAGMAGLAGALDSGAAAPASSGVTAAGPTGHGTSGWPASALGGRSTAGPRSSPSSPLGGLALGGSGSLGTSLAGLLGTTGPTAALLPTVPSLPSAPQAPGSGGVINATLPTLIVPTSTPVVLASVSVAATGSTSGSTPGGPPKPGARTSGGNGNGNGGGKTAPTAATSPGPGGHGRPSAHISPAAGRDRHRA